MTTKEYSEEISNHTSTPVVVCLASKKNRIIPSDLTGHVMLAFLRLVDLNTSKRAPSSLVFTQTKKECFSSFLSYSSGLVFIRQDIFLLLDYMIGAPVLYTRYPFVWRTAYPGLVVDCCFSFSVPSRKDRNPLLSNLLTCPSDYIHPDGERIE